jgi:hypothetical protein
MHTVSTYRPEVFMRIRINVIGCINDQKFTTRVSGRTDSETGRASIRLTYSNIPPLWHPFNYSDPLVLTPDYREEDGAFNLRSLAQSGFTAACTIDFGLGMTLRKTAEIRWSGGELHGGYAIWGTANCTDLVGIEPYEEFMHPAGDGTIIAVGMAHWRRASGEIIQACVSTRYKFDEPKDVLKIAQVRRSRVSPRLSADGLTFEGDYETVVLPL